MPKRPSRNNLSSGSKFLFENRRSGKKDPPEEVLRAFKQDLPSEEMYKKSGFKTLIQALLKSKEMRKYICGGFIEVSTYASTLYDNSLDAMNASFVSLEKLEGRNRRLNANVTKYFKKIISKLREKNLVLFNHPAFSNDPEERMPLFSYIGTGDENARGDGKIVDTVEDIYQELLEEIDRPNPILQLSGDGEKGAIQVDDPEYRLRLAIRQSNIKDQFTTYRGIRKLKRKLVEDTVNSRFPNLTKTADKLQALHYLNHKLYHERFQKGMKINPSVMVSLPLLAPHPYPEPGNLEKSKYLGMGAVFIFLMLDESVMDVEKFRQRLKEYCDNLWDLISGYLSGYVFYIGTQTLQQFDQEAIKSAIAAVMSRNMSHNIGSHVLVKLSEASNLQDSQEMVKLNQYLKHRMSFIADVSLSQTPVSGINFIHNDILKRFDNLLLLKEYISGNDSMRSNNINLKYVCAVDGLEKDTDLAIQIPGDTIGSQAIYIFLENFIRNAVKYSEIPRIIIPARKGTNVPQQESHCLEITICLSEPDNELKNSYYIMDIYDNCSRENFPIRSQLELGNKSNPARYFRLLGQLQKDIDDSILTNSAPRVGGWGILEMKICAAFLRKHPLKDIDIQPSYHQPGLPPILEVLYFKRNEGLRSRIMLPGDDCSENDLNMGYRLYLLKPKRIAFLASDFWLDGLTARDKLALHGIHFISGPNQPIPSNLDHEIFVAEEQYLQGWNEQEHGTQRVLRVRDEESKTAIKSALEKGDVGLVEELVWAYYNRQMGYIGEIGIYKGTETNIFQDKSMENMVIFDDHGSHFDQVLRAKKGGNAAGRSPVLYYDAYGSQSGTGSFIERILQDQQKNGKTWRRNGEAWQSRLQEVANIHLAILDERIQRTASGEASGLRRAPGTEKDKVYMWELFAAMKTHIPSKERLDLDKQFFDQKEEMMKGIESWISELLQTCSIRFILVHLGIIEKLLGSDPKAIANFYRQWQKKWGDKLTIIIISGRGQPSTLPDESYFIPYDCIEEYLLRNRSKFNLINLIYCTNKKDRHEE